MGISSICGVPAYLFSANAYLKTLLSSEITLFFTINIHRSLSDPVKTAYIIQPENMVGMFVGQQYGIEVGNTVFQHLLPEIRARINKQE